jgi:predicted helicase
VRLAAPSSSPADIFDLHSRGVHAEYDEAKIRRSLYRPFTRHHLFFDRVLVERVYQFPQIMPAAGSENTLVWVKVGSEWPMFALAANSIVDLLPQGGSQCFPFHTCSSDGTNRRENITDAALEWVID